MFVRIRHLRKAARSPWILCAVIAVIACGTAIGIKIHRSFPAGPPDYSKMNLAQLRAFATDRPSLGAYGALFQRVLDTGSSAEALQIARKMVLLYPRDGRAHNALGITYASMGDIDNAKTAFNNAISVDPRRIDAYLNIGRLAMRTEDYQQAVIEFDRATTVDANSASAWTGMGQANEEIHNVQEALDNYQQAIKLAPNRPQAHLYLGAFLAELGRGEDARPHLKRAEELGDRSARLYAGFAMAFADQPHSPEELTQALQYAAEAEKRGEADGLVFYARGLALQRLGRYKEAIEVYRRVIDLSMNSNGAWMGISQCLRATGKIKMADEAAKIAERIVSQRQHINNLQYVIKATPGRLDARKEYADLLMTTNQYYPAAEQYRYIAEHGPSKAAMWLRAAHALDLAGDKQSAEEARRAAHAQPAASSQAALPVSHNPSRNQP